MKRNWVKWNLLYIRAVNSYDREALSRLFDEGCDHPEFFVRKRYIWNIIRGKEFCRIFAEWIIEWYRAAESGRVGWEVMDTVVDLFNRFMVTETHDNIKRSLVWKVTKIVPLLTVHTVPYISGERLTHIMESGKHCVTDGVIRPFMDRIVELSELLDTTNTTMDTLLSD